MIITDTTKTWLDLRSALKGNDPCMLISLGHPLTVASAHAVDYDKIAAQHSRMFYWTTLEFYTPIQFVSRRRDHSYLEGYAGPFRKIDATEVTRVASVVSAAEA